MLRAEDFRIGNIISLAGKPIRISFSTLEKLCFPELSKYQIFKGVYQPIKLTEDILLKCGFIKDEFDNWENETRLGLYKPDDFDGYLSIWGDSTVGECYYLHQLQNLYFALTGKELEVRL